MAITSGGFRQDGGSYDEYGGGGSEDWGMSGGV